MSTCPAPSGYTTHLGVDPGVTHIGAASVRQPAHAQSPTPLAAGVLQWLLEGEWDCTLHHFQAPPAAKGDDAMDGVVNQMNALLHALDGHHIAAVYIERQPQALANPVVRVAEGVIHGMIAGRFASSRTARVHQDGKVKNRVVDMLAAHFGEGTGTLKFRKVARKEQWRAKAGTPGAAVQCHVTLQGARAAKVDFGEGPAPRLEPQLEPGAGAASSLHMLAGVACGMQSVDAGAFLPVSARKRARGGDDCKGWVANKAFSEGAVTALLIHRAARHPASRFPEALAHLAALDSAHRHDVCDALLHCLAGIALHKRKT